MFRNDQWDDNYDQYKVDLEVENKELRKENKKLKQQIRKMELQLPPYTFDYFGKVKWVRDEGGVGLYEATKALKLFNDDPKKALYFLVLTGDAVHRRKPNGKSWSKQDYIDYINDIDFFEKI
jgi:hypothetical protein